MFSHSGHVMTLANSIIGVGILAMPFCFQKCGIILSVVLLIISNWITRICCHYLIKSSLLTRRKSFEFLGFHAFGSSGKLLVELCIIGYLIGTCITYFVVVGDLGPQIVTKMFALKSGNVHLRTLVMIAVTISCILPLGMLKNVDSLSTVCTASIGFYVCLVIKIVLESEEHILANDWTEKVLYWRPAGVLQCLPIFSMALSCQMQLFEVFESVNNQSLEKLNGIVRDATWICTFVYIAVGIFGYVAFCTHTFSGNILLNFSPSFGSDVIKIGFILSVAFSFPLVIFPCRASIYSLIYRKGHTDTTSYIPESRFKIITVFIVGFSLCVALVIPSVELVIGLVGSTIGVAICIMFPAACFRKIVKKESTERILAQFILVSGFCLMILGTYANLNAIDEKSSGAHLDKSNVDGNLLRITQAPILPNDKVEILKENLKISEMNLENVALKEPNEILRADGLSKEGVIVNSENSKDAPDAVNVKVATAAAPPPLPVDEKHDDDTPPLKNVLEKLENVEKVPAEIRVPKIEASVLYEVNKTGNYTIPAIEIIELPVVKHAPSHKIETNEVNKIVSLKQSIDNDAIRKDDEIAAEELTNNKAAKANEDELKKTQNELKKTQELFERAVGEMKELVKQNKETKDRVEEKLGEVVGKVEEIERKVQKNELRKEQQSGQSIEQESKLPQSESAPLNRAQEQKRQNNSSLLNILTEKGKAAAEALQPQQVYEPLSYKTGELIEPRKSNPRLPLPLALLMNSSQAKINESLGHLAEQNKNSAPNPKSNNSNKMEVKYDKPLLLEVKNETDKENVGAIRRDILQYNGADKRDISTPAVPLRVKRSIVAVAPDLEAIHTKLEKEHYLLELEVEALLSRGSSAAIEFKMQNIGRDLKSLNQEEMK